MSVGIVATLLLYATEIKEGAETEEKAEKPLGVAAQFTNALRLLGNPAVLLCFLAIVCHVGMDVGINITAPKVLMERLGITLETAGFATSLYFIARTAGCLAGGFVMVRMKEWTFLLASIVLMLVALSMLFLGAEQWVLYASIVLLGLANSNPFSIIMARALQAVPDKKNEASGLMIMGLFGGTVFPLLMGAASDSFGQTGAIAVLALGAFYLLFFWRMNKA
jgi:fucose permease